MRRIILFFVCLASFSGCAKLAHLDQLLTLKAYAKNKDLQEEHVVGQDKGFEKLLQVVSNNGMDPYIEKKQFQEEFGDPVFAREAERDGISYEIWLYRYSAKFFTSEKIYLYFDKTGRLADWEHVVPENKGAENRPDQNRTTQ